MHISCTTNQARHEIEKLVATFKTSKPTLMAQAEAQIEDTDRQIDALVYELYGLTPEEIKIVEGR